MRRTLVFVTLVLLLLAGCTEKPDREKPTELPPVDPDEGRGAIRGVVFDPAVLPITGATVRIDALDLETTTDADGAFVLDDLEPGTHFLTVSKPGFLAAQTSVTVVADDREPPLTKVQLAPDAATLPRVQVLEFQGYLACSVTAVVVSAPLCALTEDVTGDDVNSVTYPTDGYPDWVQGEMTWDSTQPAGDALSFNVWDGGSFDPISVVGTSPLTIQMDQETLRYGNGTETGESPMITPGEEFAWRVFSDGVEGSNAGVCPDDVPGVISFSCFSGAGATVDQQITIYTTVFYNLVPPEEYRFLEQGAYPVPT